MSLHPISAFSMQGGIDASAPPLSDESAAALNEMSWNLIISGNGYTKPFSGAASEGGGGSGAYKMLPFGKTWGGIRPIGGGLASGSFMLDIGQSRWGIGSGQPMIEGVDVSGFVLSTNLQVQIASGGAYASPVQAGLAQPSAPTIGIVDSPGDISNPMSAKIERYRPSTGANSVASPTSAVVKPVSNQLYLTFPAASSGQTHWRVYFTFQGFGGTGVHYRAIYNGSDSIPESVVAAGTVNGIARSLQFNFKDGDLLPLEASYDDFPPPTATHAIRLQTVMNLAGCYADSTTSPTSGNTGTAIAVSKENNYESFIPTALLFLPEQVVDTLSRPIDDYGYVACEASIHALQYVGDRSDQGLPSCTITTILPDVGVQYPFNWCHFRGKLAIYTTAGNLMMMDDDGSWDTSFANQVTRLLKLYFPNASTTIGYDPKNDSIVLMSGKRSLVYSIQKREWRQVWLPDFSLAGNAQSCVAAKRTLYFTMNNSGTLSAYSWDNSTASCPFVVCSNYKRSSIGVVQDITQMTVDLQPPPDATFAAIALNKNLKRTVFRQVTTTASNVQVADSAESTDLALIATGTKILLFGTNIGGGGIHYLQTGVSGANPGGGVLNLANAPQASLTDVLMFVGDYVAIYTSRPGQMQHTPDFWPYLTEAKSLQVAVYMKGSGLTGNVLGVGMIGDEYSSARAI